MPSDLKRPAFQFYPGDWRRDTALQSCSLEARGLWIEMLILMHDGEPYGHLTAGGVVIHDDILAKLVGVSVRRVRRLLSELQSRKICSSNDAGVIYSRRMVRDEEIRRKKAAGGAKSLENPNVPRPKATEQDGSKDRRKDGAKDILAVSSSASFGGSPAVAVAPATTNYLSEFEEAWAKYPGRSGSNPRAHALHAWTARRREGVPASEMSAGLERYVRHLEASGKVDTPYVMQAKRFFGPGLEFREPWTVPDDPTEAAAEAERARQDDDDAWIVSRMNGAHP